MRTLAVGTECPTAPQVTLNNTQLACVNSPGVGGNFTFAVTVDGGSSSWSTDVLNHTTPSVLSLSGPGAVNAPAEVEFPALASYVCYCCCVRPSFAPLAFPHLPQGGARIFLNGINFGPVDNSTNIVASCAPSSSNLTFTAPNCFVSAFDAEMSCTTPPVVGSDLTWTVVVDGLQSTVPTFSTAPPTISNYSILSTSVPYVASSFMLVVSPPVWLRFDLVLPELLGEPSLPCTARTLAF